MVLPSKEGRERIFWGLADLLKGPEISFLPNWVDEPGESSSGDSGDGGWPAGIRNGPIQFKIPITYASWEHEIT